MLSQGDQNGGIVNTTPPQISLGRRLSCLTNHLQLQISRQVRSTSFPGICCRRFKMADKACIDSVIRHEILRYA